MMLDTSHKKARFSLRKTALGLVSALLGVLLLSAYVPNHTNSLVYAQENVSQNRSVMVYYVLESELTEQEKLAVQSGFPNHTNDGDSIYFVYKSLKQDLPQTSDEAAFCLSLLGIGLAGGSFMVIKTSKSRKEFLGFALVLVGGLSVTSSANWSEQLSSFNQVFLLSQNEVLPSPPEIAGYHYLGYIYKPAKTSVSNLVTNQVETEIALETLENEERTVVSDNAPRVDVASYHLSVEDLSSVVPSDYPIVEPLPTHELITDAVYTVIPEDSPSVDLPIHPLSLEEVYDVVPSDYPIVESLPTHELTTDAVYTVVPEDSPSVDLPSYPLSPEEIYEVIPSDYPIVEPLPTHELTTDAVYTVIPEDSPSVDLPSYPLSPEEIYEVVPSDYPIVAPLPTYELSSDVVYTVVPETAPSVDLPSHTLSLEEVYEVVPSDYPIVEPLPTYELSSDVAYTVVPETAPSVDLPSHTLSLEEFYEVVPSDYPTVESLPTYELSSDVAYTVVPEDSPSVDLPIHTLSPEDIYEVVPSDYPTVEPLPTHELTTDAVYTVVPESVPSVDLPSHILSSEEVYEVVPSDYPIVEPLPTHELTTDAVYTVVPEDSPSVDLPIHTLSTEEIYSVVPSDYPIVESLPDFDVSSLPKTTDVNDNWVDYVAEDGSDRRILWAKGVKGPRMGAGGDFKKSIFGDYVDYKAPFVLDNGWYDANKRRDGDSRIDASLCFAAVSTNMLYWWLDQNKEEVGRYLEELEKSGYFDNIEANTIKDLRYLVSQPGVQQDSTIYNLFVNYFYDRFNGYQSDILMDFFINGYAPKPGGGTNDEDQEFVKDQRAGFFNAIFGNKKLTKRQFSGSYQTFSQTVKTALENNQLIGMEHLLSSRLNHIVTLWGAEFDADDRLVAVYVTDSDDQDDYRQLGMKRYLVKDIGGRVKVSTDISQSNNGSNVEYLHILSLGKEYWKAYFEGNP